MSNGKSMMGAAGAAGLTRVGMRWARSKLSEIQDRYRPERDMKLKRAWLFAERFPGAKGTGLADLAEAGERLRPMRGQLLVEMDDPHASARAAGLEIPDIAQDYAGQAQGAYFTVLAVGAGVTSVTPGDRVVAFWGLLAWGEKHGNEVAPYGLGQRVGFLRAPEYRCGSRDPEESHRHCGCGGDVLAIVEC